MKMDQMKLDESERDLRVKDMKSEEAVGPVRQPFLIKSCEQGASNIGKPYLNISLADETGVIDARKWEIKLGDLDLFRPNTILMIDGTIIRYKGKNQVKINRASPVDMNTIDRSRFVPHAPLTSQQLKDQVVALVESIVDPQIKAVVKGVMNDTWKSYSTYPAAVTVHQAYETGLIYHSLCVCKIACAIVDLYPGVFHRDYVVAGTLLHDIGKVQELSGPVGTKYTRIGKLESHIQIGAMIVNRKCLELGLDQEKTDLLTHIILSHHGLPEYGSAVRPKTADAFLVHLADDADAKINVIENAMKTVRPGEFTDRIPWMDNIELYRPTFDGSDPEKTADKQE